MSDRPRLEAEMARSMATETYTQRNNQAFADAMALRTATSEVSFFLAHLHSGMQVLDVGSGPGSITLGLAEAVAPGEVVGVDLQPGQVQQARARAAECNVENVRFETANVYELPFPDGSFDAVLAHTVFVGLSEPVRALMEMRRVLRPGGVIGLRDPDWDADLFAPASALMERWWSVRRQVNLHNGGDPFGRHHRRRLLEAGFARAEAQASVSSAGTVAETHAYAAFLKAQLAGMTPVALDQGWLVQAEIDALSTEFDAWAERPDAFSARILCEAIGWVDG